ncbi:hypothetical protein SAMN05216436_12633 [bacterium A37T11]|nr:hypothetical protein SAMN05216436_12633 [bacterium A37T11]
MIKGVAICAAPFFMAFFFNFAVNEQSNHEFNRTNRHLAG